MRAVGQINEDVVVVDEECGYYSMVDVTAGEVVWLFPWASYECWIAPHVQELTDMNFGMRAVELATDEGL